jgi:hypothetical protein
LYVFTGDPFEKGITCVQIINLVNIANITYIFRQLVLIRRSCMIRLCPHCTTHFLSFDSDCPNCKPLQRKSRSLSIVPALLGLSLVGCGEKPKDTGTSHNDSNVEDTWDTNVEPPYGVGAYDEDGDGFEYSMDCDDQDASIYPGAAELDSDTECMKDSDYDGYGDNGAGSFVSGTDCNDSDATINPSATEITGDGIDQNCDGVD